jgi:uncharacterized SAM-binding protein YcdF (DUF218 family)
MFFFLSKILAFITSPLIWVFALLIWSWKTKVETRRKKLFWVGIGMLYFFSNSFIADEFMRWWEIKYEKEDYAPEQTQNFDYAVVLGGMFWYNEKLEKPQFMRSADRLFQALWLLKQKKVKKIIFSGGSGSIEHPDHKEGEIIKRWLKQMDFPDSCIVVESESKNTHENALNTKSILETMDYKNKKVILVTSAFHMRRALACFKKVGVDGMTPYITDCYSGPRKFGWDHCFIPTSDAWSVWQPLIHEWVGYVTYKLAGYC